MYQVVHKSSLIPWKTSSFLQIIMVCGIVHAFLNMYIYTQVKDLQGLAGASHFPIPHYFFFVFPENLHSLSLFCSSFSPGPPANLFLFAFSSSVFTLSCPLAAFAKENYGWVVQWWCWLVPICAWLAARPICALGNLQGLGVGGYFVSPLSALHHFFLPSYLYLSLLLSLLLPYQPTYVLSIPSLQLDVINSFIPLLSSQ